MVSHKSNLDIYKATRKIASKSLANALRTIMSRKSVSEVGLRGEWLKELRKHSEIFPDGWYMPPPHGIGVLFATDENPRRINFKTLRTKNYWPREDIVLNKKNGMLVVYASPVNRDGGIIGDFGLTIYLGEKSEIRNHLRNCFNTVYQIFENLETGTTLSEFYNSSEILFAKKGLVNNWWLSRSDPTGINMGHTIPSTYEGWSNKEVKVLQRGDWKKVCSLISGKREFINAREQAKIKPGMALSVEPRLKIKNDLKTPSGWFHAVALFKEKGGKELLTGFDEIFRLTGMNYMLL
jgi:hypothetical protein